MKPVFGAGVALLALVSACSPGGAPNSNEVATSANVAATKRGTATKAAEQAAPMLAVAGEGLRLFDRDTGSARPVPFGTPREAALAALAFRGEPAATGRLEECGAGPLDYARWGDGLTLYFQDSRLAGWALDGSGKDSPTTASGLGVGSTRAELEAAYDAEVFDSTLGTEFAAGEIFGILDGTGPSAKIAHLWAGTSCTMR